MLSSVYYVVYTAFYILYLISCIIYIYMVLYNILYIIHHRKVLTKHKTHCQIYLQLHKIRFRIV